MRFVVDASVIVASLTDPDDGGQRARGYLVADGRVYAPPHLSVEVMHTLRGLALARKLSASGAEAALSVFQELAFRSIPLHGVLLDRVWELRHNITAYDAAYVAVAEHLNLPLVTGDARLAAASGPKCEMRVLH